MRSYLVVCFLCRWSAHSSQRDCWKRLLSSLGKMAARIASPDWSESADQQQQHASHPTSINYCQSRWVVSARCAGVAANNVATLVWYADCTCVFNEPQRRVERTHAPQYHSQLEQFCGASELELIIGLEQHVVDRSGTFNLVAHPISTRHTLPCPHSCILIRL